MERILLDEVIHTDYGQFDLVYGDDGGFDGEWQRFFAGQVNGLVGAGDKGGIYVNLSRRSGGSHVRVVLLDEAPGEDLAWEDVVEVSSSIPVGSHVRWMSWAAETSGDLSGIAAGDYRVRVSARGRDRGAEDEFADGVIDSYLVQLWPASIAPDAILRTTSRNAEYWHGQWGSR